MIKFYFKTSLFTILLISFIFADEDQNSVTGSVINKSEGRPLKGANVELHKGRTTNFTTPTFGILDRF